ncbi:hypothetical protein KCU71_g935, partial [Aureobasidium melanogenum]
MGFTVFKKESIERKLELCTRKQDLGGKVGRVDVRCTLQAHRSRWTTRGKTELCGLLLFYIELADHRRTPLKSATVTIDLEAPLNDDPELVIDGCFTATAIMGSPIVETIHKTGTFEPEVTVGAAGVDIDAKGGSFEKQSDVTVEHRSCFKAGHPSAKGQTKIRKADFTWLRTSRADLVGPNRLYAGALVVSSSRTKPLLQLKVRVEVNMWHSWQTLSNGRSRYKISDPIGPREGEDMSYNFLDEDLEQWTIVENTLLAPTSKSTLELRMLLQQSLTITRCRRCQTNPYTYELEIYAWRSIHSIPRFIYGHRCRGWRSNGQSQNPQFSAWNISNSMNS